MGGELRGQLRAVRKGFLSTQIPKGEAEKPRVEGKKWRETERDRDWRGPSDTASKVGGRSIPDCVT